MNQTADMQALIDRATLTDLVYKLAYAEDGSENPEFDVPIRPSLPSLPGPHRPDGKVRGAA